MKNNSINSDNEIDLIELSKTIWNGKIIIVLITIIFVLITFIYNLFQEKPEPRPKRYISTLTISPTKNLNFYSFSSINDYLNLDKSNQIIRNQLNLDSKSVGNLAIDNSTILKSFIKEIMDYEEIIYVLKNNKNISKKISDLSKENQIKELHSYTKLFTIKYPKDPLSRELGNFEIDFIWTDPEESKKILSEIIELTSANLHTSFFNEFEERWALKKKKINSNKIKVIEFLEEQSAIAKEVDLVSDYNVLPEKYNFSLNIKTDNDTYYLRGFKAIDKEIEIIKKRKNFELINIKEKINNLKNTNFNWINYNVNLMNTRLLSEPLPKSRNLPLGLTIFMGLIVGIIFVLIKSAKK